MNIPAQDSQEAIRRLREVEVTFRRKADVLRTQIQEEKATARKHGTQNKRAAQETLQIMKGYEKQLELVNSTVLKIKKQREMFESALTNAEVFKVLSEVAEVSQSMHNLITVDDVKDMMSDIIRDEKITNQVRAALVKPIEPDMDEDKLMAELEKLRQEPPEEEPVEMIETTQMSGKKDNKAPTPQEAIQHLRETDVMLQKKYDVLETKIEQEIATARKHGTKNERAAIPALQIKKRYEKQLQQINGTLSNIKRMREALGTKIKRAATQALQRKKRHEKQLQQIDGILSNIEFQREAPEILKVMGDATKALKSMHSYMDVDDVHNLMEDIAEQQEIANEISNAISKHIGLGQNIDEDGLMVVLDELDQEALDEELIIVEPTIDTLPAVPNQPQTIEVEPTIDTLPAP